MINCQPAQLSEQFPTPTYILQTSGKEIDNKYRILSLDFLNIEFNFTGLIAYIGLDLLTYL